MRGLELPRAEVAAVLASGFVLLVLVVAGYGLAVLGVAVIAPILVAILRRPQFGIMLIVALVPFHGLLTIADVPEPLIAWKEVLGGVVFAATFVCPLSARAPKGRSRPSWFAPLVAFAVLAAISAAVAHNEEALVGLKITFFWVLAGLAVWRCPLNPIERDRLVSILMAVGFVCAVIGLWQQVVGPAALNALGYEYNTTIRSAGTILRSFSTFAEPFAFAFYLMGTMLIATPIALSEPRRLRNRLYLLAFPIFTLGLLATVVRGGILGLGVGFAYLGFRKYRLLLAALPLAIMAVVVLSVLGGSFSSSFSSGSSFADRQAGWEENFVELTRHPFGVQIGSTGAAAATAAGDAPVPGIYNPDNYYFKTVYELGVLGLWILAVFLASAFGATRRTASRAAPRDVPLLDGITALVLGAAAASLVANFFDAFPTNVDFAILLGVAACLGARTPTDDDDDDLEHEAAALVA